MAKVLIVDDQPTLRRISAKVLGLDGHRVWMAQNGLDALSIIKTEHPDIVLLDIMMPGIDGYQVCRQIKTDPETRDTIVIVITAMPPEQRISSYRAGADDHVTKPISPTELRDLIWRWSTKRKK